MATPQPEPVVDAPRLIGGSEAMRSVRRRLTRVAATDAQVLLLGETGTGKSLAARAIHERSSRAGGPFVTVDCAALAPTVIESELFGHERGAFTGAITRHRGRFERAAGGTVFVDEVGELPPALQAKLLAVLEERRFERVGGEQPLRLEARLVAATHRRLEAEVRAGRFRADLYFRLRVVTIELPPLRERCGDLFALVSRSLPVLAARLGIPTPAVTTAFLARLAAHGWPGNVRELLHVLERVLVLSEGGILVGADLDGCFDAALEPAPEGACDEEGARIARVLRETGGNVSRAARRLGVARGTLRYRIQRHGLDGLVPMD